MTSPDTNIKPIEPPGGEWPIGSHADHLRDGPARARLFRSDRHGRLQAVLGLTHLDLAYDCLYAWRLTHRRRFAVAAVAGLMTTMAMLLCSATLGLSLALAWFGLPARGWIALGALSAALQAAACAVAEAFAPGTTDPDVETLRGAR